MNYHTVHFWIGAFITLVAVLPRPGKQPKYNGYDLASLSLGVVLMVFS